MSKSRDSVGFLQTLTSILLLQNSRGCILTGLGRGILLAFLYPCPLKVLVIFNPWVSPVLWGRNMLDFSQIKPSAELQVCSSPTSLFYLVSYHLSICFSFSNILLTSFAWSHFLSCSCCPHGFTPLFYCDVILGRDRYKHLIWQVKLEASIFCVCILNAFEFLLLLLVQSHVASYYFLKINVKTKEWWTNEFKF